MSKLSIIIRPATQDDETIIKAMIKREHLDPIGLDWENFLIAEVDNHIAGIGQIKPHIGCEELGSLVTNPEFQGQGVGRTMISALEARAGRPLYLKCLAKMEPYYEKFGYQTIPWWQAPSIFKLIGLMMMTARLFGVEGRIMRKDA
ncbi:MAG: GNAT family N-acetyltransferase [Phototrophicaceae bacterium]